VAAGLAWEAIVEEWRGNVSSEAIAEAVRLASQAFRDHSAQYAAPEYVLERAPA
jgi:heme oxygenase